MKRLIPFLITTMFLAALPAAAQSVPEIPFDSVANPLTLPDDIYLGEIGGVAANSKGDIFVYTRTGHPTVSLGTARPFAHGGSRLFQFDKNGKVVREIGANSYGFIFAQQVRIDPQDNVWIVDQMTNFVEKLDSAGHPQLLLGRKPEAIPVPAPRGDGGARGGGEGGGARGGGLPGAGAQSDVFNRPTDVAWDSAGNIFVADGVGNARVAKFNSKGVVIKSWGSKGNGPGQFGTVRAIAVDGQGNVYVADSTNKGIEDLDNNGNFKTQ